MFDIMIHSATCFIKCGESSLDAHIAGDESQGLSTGYLVAHGVVLATLHGVWNAVEFGQTITVRFAATEKAPAVECSATVIDHNGDLDACLLALSADCQRLPLPLFAGKPRAGSRWQSFGYPITKPLIGHRLEGTISRVLPVPTAKLDMDLLVDSNGQLNDYSGVSGAVVADLVGARGMIRLRMDGSLGAISIHELAPFLNKHGIVLQIEDQEDSTTDSQPVSGSGRNLGGQLAQREEFQKSFEEHLLKHPGEYLFLEGVHGIGKTSFCNTFSPSRTELAVLGTYSFTPSPGGSNAFTRSRPDVFIDWLSVAVSVALYGSPPRRETLSYPEMAQRARQLLQAFSEHCRLNQQHGLLFIDGLNEIKDSDSARLLEFLALLPGTLPPNVCVILTSLSHPGVAGELAGRVLHENILSLPPLSMEASAAFCRQELDEAHTDPAFVHQLCERAQGHPLYLSYLIRYANDHPEEDELEDFPILDGEIERYYERIWQKVLQDSAAFTLLALIARLRPGIDMEQFKKALTDPEADSLIPTLSRVGHLLNQSDQPAIYHASFATFLIGKTVRDEERLQTRLGIFCQRETSVPYCVLNVVYHLLRGGETSRSNAVAICTQSWVDACTIHSVAPDVLIADLRDALAAASKIDAVETIRLLLLKQRVEFRYDTLFTQSAKQIARALIGLGRPTEALDHVVRYDALVTDAWSALQISHTLIEVGYDEHATALLQRIRLSCEAAYGTPNLTLEDFLRICQCHIYTCLLLHYAGHENMFKSVFQVRQSAKSTLKYASKGSSALLDEIPELLAPLDAIPQAYLIHFEGRYFSLHEIGGGRADTSWINPKLLADILLCCANLKRTFSLPSAAVALTELFTDIAQVIEQGVADDEFASADVVDTLILLGAPHNLVSIAEAGTIIKTGAPTGSSRAANGVDLDFDYIERSTWHGRTLGFLDAGQPLPLILAPPESSGTGWLQSFEDVLHALAICDGKLRRAIADGNDSIRVAIGRHLIDAVLPALRFSLKQRVQWDRAYALPETLTPLLYEHAAEVLRDCYPEGIPGFLKDVEERSTDQLGLYSEGFRASVRGIVNILQRPPANSDAEAGAEYATDVFRMLGKWRDHVLAGVENRHELIPELLELISAFTRSGATEEAERLFQRMLAVSMGPSWYKEDQLSLMATVLGEVPTEDSVSDRIAAVAGYLDRASGEMTFGRYVRSQKSDLPGLLFARKRFRQACEYFVRQTCGDTEHLASEWGGHTFDAPTPHQGNRHPGGSLEEQQAIISMVEHGTDIPWRLRWALLETFHLGDRRHTKDFARSFAGIINEIATEPNIAQELVGRVEKLAVCEIPRSRRAEFVQTLLNGVAGEHKAAFATMARYIETPLHEAEEHTFETWPNEYAVTDTADQAPEDEAKPGDLVVQQDSVESEPAQQEPAELYVPGLFGHRSAIEESDALLASAMRDIEIGNRRVAKDTLINMLRVLQSGDWGIWGNLSDTATQAEKLIAELSEDASDLVRAYSPLVHNEHRTDPWRVADHLISRAGHLMRPTERLHLFDIVLEHTSLMVGDSTEEKAKYAFLSDEEPVDSPSLDVFSFLLWLLDHPKWIRRDRAAVTLAWLLRADSSFDQAAVPTAFGMTSGYAADLLCGIFDIMSREDPIRAWQRILPHLDIAAFNTNCNHVSRVATLWRIADRAGAKGAVDAVEVARETGARFHTGFIALPDSDGDGGLRGWADCMELELEALVELGVLNSWRKQDVVEQMKRLCSPLSIDDTRALEKAVCLSFQEDPHQLFGRWEAKVRFALNCALFPYISTANVEEVCSALRIYNPAMPDLTVDPTFDSRFDVIATAIRNGDYATAIGDDKSYFLHYRGSFQADNPDSKNNIDVLVIAVLSESSEIGGRIHPPSDNTIVESTDVPDLQKPCDSQDTCFFTHPRRLFLGACTPAWPVPAFVERVGAQPDAFRRITWRQSRSTYLLGRPEYEGCLLQVMRPAVRLPEGTRLSWFIFVNGSIIAIVDENGNTLH